MNKLYISALLIFCCIEQIQSMELKPIFNNEMSIQLYAPDITEEKILELVKNGADVN